MRFRYTLTWGDGSSVRYHETKNEYNEDQAVGLFSSDDDAIIGAMEVEVQSDSSVISAMSEKLWNRETGAPPLVWVLVELVD